MASLIPENKTRIERHFRILMRAQCLVYGTQFLCHDHANKLTVFLFFFTTQQLFSTFHETRVTTAGEQRILTTALGQWVAGECLPLGKVSSSLGSITSGKNDVTSPILLCTLIQLNSKRFYSHHKVFVSDLCFFVTKASRELIECNTYLSILQ